MKTILFYDAVAYKPYTYNTLNEGLGGSEATLIRIAVALAATHNVLVFQAVDAERQEENVQGVRHIGYNGLTETPDVVIHQRSGSSIKDMRQEFPNARHIMWAHDFFVDAGSVDGLDNEEVIVLSDAHYDTLVACTKAYDVMPKGAHKMYNPVCSGLVNFNYEKIPGRLGFFSSPHKGLDQVIETFNTLRNQTRFEHLSLAVANPGYYASQTELSQCVVPLGVLSHNDTLMEMSRCEILFYPQTKFPETFGLVLAEANAKGIPVLAHGFGAAKEVLAQKGNEIINCNEFAHIESAVVSLLQNKPVMKADPRFKLDAITKQWLELLGD